MREQPFRLYGVFGHPLSHTLSPAMQEAAFEKLGIKAYYLALDLDTAQFKKAMRALSKKFLLEGFNITVPHKQTVVPYLDQLTPEARAIGAVNTVFRRGRKWIGANTDVDGFLESLRRDGRFNPRGKKVLVLGAGGAARAVVYALAKSGAREIVIANRTLSHAQKIICDFKRIFSRVKFESKGTRYLLNPPGTFSPQLVVNATSVGVKSEVKKLLPSSLIPSGTRQKILFFDLVYHKPTRFMVMAKKKKHPAIGGLGMLLYQGAKAFELWTGKKAPVEVMRRALAVSLLRPAKNLRGSQ